MFSLTWYWPDDTKGYVVGNLEDLATVKYALTLAGPGITFAIRAIDTGLDAEAIWLREDERHRWADRPR